MSSTHQPTCLTYEQVREFDRLAIERFEIPSIVLMENAARGACDELEDYSKKHSIPSSAAILCGPGNNGGDGLVMARHLHLRGWKVKVALLANRGKLSQDTAANLRILGQTKIPVTDFGEADVPDPAEIHGILSQADWIIDAMVGTGAKPPLRQPMASWVEAANRANAKRMAVDIPSGLASTPEHFSQSTKENEHSVFEADLTVTFVAAKPNLLTEAGKAACGITKIVDIGAPPEVFEHLKSSE